MREMRIGIGLLLTAGLSVFSVSGAELIKNGSFEEGLAHWNVRGQGRIDEENAAFGKKSLRIEQKKVIWQRVYQDVKVKPQTSYVLEYYVKCANVVPKKGARFAGAGSWVSLKKYFPHHGSRGAWKLDQGNMPWQKVSFEFKTGKEDHNIALQFQLSNSTGCAWFDKVSLKEKNASAKKVDQQIRLELYPVAFLGGETFKVAENLAGTLYVSARSSMKFAAGEKAEMILDMPSFIRVTGGVPNMSLQRGTGEKPLRTYPTYKVEEKGTVQRNGREFRRFRLQFDSDFLRFLPASWYNHFVFLKAEKGSVGQKGDFYCHVRAGKWRSQEIKGQLETIPAIERKAPPCKYFSFLMAKCPLLTSLKDLPGKKANADFWKSMAVERYSWVRPCDVSLEGFRPIVIVGGNFWSVFDSVQNDLKYLKRTLPANITDKGTKRHGFAVWSKLDDKSGRVERIYRTAAQELKRLHPEAREVVWDFEPHPYGFDLKGRERFARAHGLKHTPSIAEINSRYRNLWFKYMVKLHAEYANRFMRIFKESAPGVKFYFCSDNLYAAGDHISAWCGVDVRLSDEVADGHMHMPYYAGVRFFDDCGFNIRSLKKPFFPLIDPAEALYSYYRQYSADKVKQNIVAVASQGGKGIGFWPHDALSADYLKGISEGYDLVSAAEEFYAKGRRADDKFQVTVVNAMVKTVKNAAGKSVKLYFPDFPSVLRKTVHEFRKDVLFTLFNYHESEEMLLEIKGNGKKLYVNVPPNGVKLVRLSDKQSAAVLKKIEDFRKRGSSFKIRELKKGNAALEWSISPEGVPYFKLSNGRCSAGVDLLKDAGCNSLVSEAGGELLSGGFLGRLIFYDTLQPEVISKIHSMQIKNGVPEVTVKGIVGAYAGANPVINPLLELEILRKYTLKDQTLFLELTFFNPTGKDMPLGFRLNNYPAPGKRFGAAECVSILSSMGRKVRIAPGKNLFALKGSVTPFTGKNFQLWDHGPIQITAAAGSMKEAVTIVPDKKFCGVMSWFGVRYNTAELLTPHLTLPAGKKMTFRCEYRIDGR